ncbi:MAG: methionyl-tRNA formyltransferase [Prevotella sp.]|nr:methionyl-tRNA formyltransferase [Prevotella sp.]
MNKEDLRIVFMGTPEFAVETLKALVENQYRVVAVVTQPDKPVGRHGSVLQPSAVKQYALEQGLPVLQPEKMKDPAFVEQLRAYRANLQVVVAFRMLPEVVWAMPEYGTFNVHAALLPQYRGAAPINWAVINGETETGVTTFFLDHDIDTGRIIEQMPFAIPDEADVEYVYDGLMHLGARICLSTLGKIIASGGHPETVSQDNCHPSSVTLQLKPAPKIFKETCQIDWTQPAKRVYDFVRGLSPYPGAWTTLVDENGRETVLKVFRTTKTQEAAQGGAGSLVVRGRHLLVSCADGLLQVDELQLAGKKRMDAQAFLNGMKDIGKYSVRQV